MTMKRAINCFSILKSSLARTGIEMEQNISKEKEENTKQDDLHQQCWMCSEYQCVAPFTQCAQLVGV
jgi:hypothetical protein